MPRLRDQPMYETDRLRVALGVAKAALVAEGPGAEDEEERHLEIAMLQDAYTWHLARDAVTAQLDRDPDLYYEIVDFARTDEVWIRTDGGKQRERARIALARVKAPKGVLVGLEHV